MSLVPATCAADLWSGYSPIVTGSTVDYGAVFSAAYNTYATAGVLLGATNTGGTASILSAFIDGRSSQVATQDGFAQALADYWSGVAVIPGTPAHGGLSVESVVNDATSHVATFKAAIVASITDTDTTPYFETLIYNIQTALASVVWTVTELMPGTPPYPVAYPEMIS